ncbi:MULTISPECIES: hypothetical protein [Enterobacteriaceae]|uniref:Uncharacterized protein n=1 Tax=Salmonella gallinarum TaxID=594 RepID=A0A752MFA3_SALGL|nr:MULTISPECIES: hypothetical protein [Enterobacteriaceae]MBZ5027410.1 hypothetical protein [Salmonella enterica subsp. enterica serovar Typhimurium]HAF7491206.1 hypothetical protein [Salmonella enterica subsp. enterica serovar Gallinarum]AZV12408.1 hypothetical protein EK422_23470 [Salmonella enterica subsp. enterica serovar Braenderup str. ATCC BAA-664]EAW7856263.1 hypothetical protein [Salmonella enterica]EAW7897803.1 hypothetical protein [Salmonella enterica]
MGTISFGKAMFKGTIKLLLITLIIIAICFAIGFSLNYFDFYPFYLSDIGVDKNSYAGFFLLGFGSLPIIAIISLLMIILIAVFVFIILLLGGYYE